MLNVFYFIVIYCYSFYILMTVNPGGERTTLSYSASHFACFWQPSVIFHLKYWISIKYICPFYEIIANVNFSRTFNKKFHSTESNAFSKSKKSNIPSRFHDILRYFYVRIIITSYLHTGSETFGILLLFKGKSKDNQD